MVINKCDLCKKTLDEEKVTISLLRDAYKKFDLCYTCANPILRFLTANKLLDISFDFLPRKKKLQIAREAKWALKHGKRYTNVRKLHDEILGKRTLKK